LMLTPMQMCCGGLRRLHPDIGGFGNRLNCQISGRSGYL
jgi:hypothetical protein